MSTLCSAEENSITQTQLLHKQNHWSDFFPFQVIVGLTLTWWFSASCASQQSYILHASYVPDSDLSLLSLSLSTHTYHTCVVLTTMLGNHRTLRHTEIKELSQFLLANVGFYPMPCDPKGHASRAGQELRCFCRSRGASSCP